MSSGSIRQQDLEDQQQFDEDREWLISLSEKIRDINPTGPEFYELHWIVQNKERILGNRRLIELLR